MAKQPENIKRPFPWKCRNCLGHHVFMRTIAYDAQAKHDGVLHNFTVPRLRIPICRVCKEKVFTDEVERQIDVALQEHLKKE